VFEPVITPLRTTGRAPRVLTVDLEDWFHVCGDGFYSDPRRWEGFAPRVEESFGTLLELLRRGGHRATVFVLGWIARRHPGLVRRAVEDGHEIGVHGDLHTRADEMTAAEFRDDLRRARDSVESAAGARSTVHRAAEWSIRSPRSGSLAVLAEEGFSCDASMMPVPPLGDAGNPNGPFRLSRDGWSLLEVPPLSGRALGVRLPLGGAWPFRTLPVARLARAEEEARSRGVPAVFTIHPWELDGEAHPTMDGLPAELRAVHFAGLRRFPERFRRWLARERTVTLSDAVARLVPAEAA
jgi:polysaccharide deacetylase family protein (PEP-CTERM system associated)